VNPDDGKPETKKVKVPEGDFGLTVRPVAVSDQK
jgi:hypothetical protein